MQREESEMVDLIKREDAIKAVEEWAVNLGNPRMLVREDAILVLKSIPSAEKQGEWIPYEAPLNFGNGEYYVTEHKCSACGYLWGEPDYNYCPECGAKMDEVTENV
jgi:rubrerythrin